jgi:hypothetical protein
MATTYNSNGAAPPISPELLVACLAERAAQRDILDWCNDASILVAYARARTHKPDLEPAHFADMFSSSTWLKDAMGAITSQSDVDALSTAQSLQFQAEAEWQKIVDKMKRG